MIRTFLDANVLIAAHRGQPAERQGALALLAHPERLFVSSPFLYLEIVPKAVYNGRHSEVAFYRTYFETKVLNSVEDVAAITQLAREEAERCGLSAMDALHAAAASIAEADELVTLEGPGKPLHRSSLVRVVHLQAAE
ncbi:MAG: PIN domain-containing protein [Acidobacteriota bacterium]